MIVAICFADSALLILLFARERRVKPGEELSSSELESAIGFLRLEAAEMIASHRTGQELSSILLCERFKTLKFLCSLMDEDKEKIPELPMEL